MRQLGAHHPLLLLERPHDVDQDVLGGGVEVPHAIHAGARELADLGDAVRQLTHDDVILDRADLERPGQAARGDRAGISRYGTATIPMDEARASCAIDVSGRAFLAYDAELPAGAIGNFDHELAEEFFRAVASAARLTLHVELQAGTNAHHMIEASFKAFARALRAAVAVDPTETGVPSTKGTLT